MPYSKVAIADASLSEEELMITPPPARRTKSMDDLLDDAGGFGAAQALTTAFAFACFVVHGAQVMSMAFVAPAAWGIPRKGEVGGTSGGSPGSTRRSLTIWYRE